MLIDKYFPNAALRCVPYNRQSSKAWLWFGVSFIATLLILALYYLSSFPGSFGHDPLNQLSQVASGTYNNWHPVLYTLLFFTLPISLAQSPVWIVPFQMLCFALALAYLIYSLSKLGAPGWFCALTLCFIILNPITGNIHTYPIKDCALAIMVMVVLGMYLQIVITKGKWLMTRVHFVLFSIFLVLCTMIRHNAVLFTGPLLFSVIVFALQHSRTRILLVLSTIIVYIMINLGLTLIINPQQVGLRTTETTGLCMTIMGNVIVEAPEQLGEDVKAFLYEVAPKEMWAEHYTLGNWNDVKWSGANLSPIEHAGRAKILLYTLKAFLKAPREATRAFAAVTSMLWQLDGEILWYDYYSFPSEGLTTVQIPSDLSNMSLGLLAAWNDLCKSAILKHLFVYLGWVNLLCFAFALAKSRLQKTLAPMFYVLPLLCYNFGTALLLSGYDWRFFYFSLIAFFPMIILLLREDGVGDEVKKNKGLIVSFVDGFKHS